MLSRKVLIFLAIILFFCFVRKGKDIEKFIPIYGYLTGTNDRLYYLLSQVKSLLEKNSIIYSITGKILHSAVTQQRLVRGDTIAVLLIPSEKVNELIEMADEFLGLGLNLTDMKDGTFRLGGAMTLPFVSDTAIFFVPVTLAGDKWITEGKYTGLNEWYEKNELFPGKMYALGTVDLIGPSNPVPYLQRNFWTNNGNNTILGNIQHPIKMIYPIPKNVLHNASYNFIGSPVENDIFTDDKYNRYNKTYDILENLQNNQQRQETVIMGNGQPIVIPVIRNNHIPRRRKWKKLFWN